MVNIRVRGLIMTTKLTLSIEKDIIENAKIYAERHSKSLSRLIQDYLESISKTDRDEISRSIPPITKELAGILKGKKQINFREDITSYLEKKYK